MSDVLKIKIGVAVAFAMQLFYISWFTASTLGQINQTFAVDRQSIEYNRQEIKRLEMEIDKLESLVRRGR